MSLLVNAVPLWRFPAKLCHRPARLLFCSIESSEDVVEGSESLRVPPSPRSILAAGGAILFSRLQRASSMQCARLSLHSDRPLYTCWIMGSRERISRCVNAFGRNGNANTMYPTATRPSAHSGCERSSAASAISSSQSCRNDPACRGSGRPCLRVIAAGPISAARGSTVAVRCLSLQR